MRHLEATARAIAAMAFATVCATCAAQGPADRPTEAARRVAKDIRREVLLPPNGPEGRPLPLASHWNVGLVAGTFEPDHQIGLLQDGHHVLPWMAWPSDEIGSDRFAAYYERLIRYYAALDLPLSMRGTQWNAMLVGKAYRGGPDDQWPGVLKPDGKRQNVLSPFGPIEPWKDPAKRYVATPGMKRLQELCPKPPRVLWVSNNEPPDLRWAKHGPLEKQSRRYLDKYGQERSDEFKRHLVGQGWIERYSVMFDAMRSALVAPAWRRNVRFVGYGAFGPGHLGRWNGWMVYSLWCEKWTDPSWHVWQGGSPSYYTNNWSDNRDHWVFSTQVEAMNWLFMLAEAWKANPDFWWEFSLWDGSSVRPWMQGLGVGQGEPNRLAQASSRPLNERQRRELPKELLGKAKALQYLADGQTYPPERRLGWVQFGLWLTRPRAVREFRGHAEPMAPVKAYWMQTVKAVDLVWNTPALREFWRHGHNVPNTAHKHPYQVNVPEKYRKVPRWYGLDTSLDPPRPWGLKADLPVFALALVKSDSAGRKQWLVYAHSPRGDRKDVTIQVPGFGPITVDVAQAGSFYTVADRDRGAQPIRFRDDPDSGGVLPRSSHRVRSGSSMANRRRPTSSGGS